MAAKEADTSLAPSWLQSFKAEVANWCPSAVVILGELGSSTVDVVTDSDSAILAFVGLGGGERALSACTHKKHANEAAKRRCSTLRRTDRPGDVSIRSHLSIFQ